MAKYNSLLENTTLNKTEKTKLKFFQAANSSTHGPWLPFQLPTYSMPLFFAFFPLTPSSLAMEILANL